MAHNFMLALARFLRDEGEDWSDFLSDVKNGSKDWFGDRYRVIHHDDIDEILADELAGDPYVLGCFNDWFIADNSNLDLEIVQALQQAEKYEALGNYLINNKCVEAMARSYASTDGYGHHFAHYDGKEPEFGKWSVFKVN